MSNSFTFKKFKIIQENAAFKVGTDSVVLGAWAEIKSAQNILDIGTGTGLLALMCAQQNPSAQIIAIEKDEASYQDARHNFLQSAWNDRCSMIHVALEDYSTDKKFDYIICNPPYFLQALLPPDERKADARHVSKHWFSVLADKIDLLLAGTGAFGCVLPQKEFGCLCAALSSKDLRLSRTQKLLPYPNGDKIRVLAEWKRQDGDTLALPDLHVRDASREFSGEYRSLTKDFYLKF